MPQQPLSRPFGSVGRITDGYAGASPDRRWPSSCPRTANRGPGSRESSQSRLQLRGPRRCARHFRDSGSGPGARGTQPRYRETAHEPLHKITQQDRAKRQAASTQDRKPAATRTTPLPPPTPLPPNARPPRPRAAAATAQQPNQKPATPGDGQNTGGARIPSTPITRDDHTTPTPSPTTNPPRPPGAQRPPHCPRRGTTGRTRSSSSTRSRRWRGGTKDFNPEMQRFADSGISAAPACRPFAL